MFMETVNRDWVKGSGKEELSVDGFMDSRRGTILSLYIVLSY